MSETAPGGEQHGYLPAATCPLYGTLYRPAGAPARALLLADPFGEEKRCAHRMLVRLARRLAAAGIAVLKFDFSGTGDSGGLHEHADWAGWRSELVTAAQFLRGQCGEVPLALLGSRAGALLAAEAAALLPLDQLLLVEPLLSGEELILDLLRREKIRGALQGQGQADPEQLWEAGQTADIGGIRINPALAAAARRSGLLAALEPLPATVPLLVLRVSGSKKLPPAWEPLAALAGTRPGSQVRLVADKPFWGQLEYYESDSVVDAVADFLLHRDTPAMQE